VSTRDENGARMAPHERRKVAGVGRAVEAATMRRASDIRGRERTGIGRRGRDSLTTGNPPDHLRESGGDLEHLAWFAADDLRAAALSMSSIESYLITIHRALKTRGSGDGLDGLAETEIDNDLDKLERSLSSLRRTLRRMGRAGVEPG